jgi:diguanylate cyclase (GGDEF)-like protein
MTNMNDAAQAAGGDAPTDGAAAALAAIWMRRRDEVLAALGVVESAILDGLAGQLDDERRDEARRCAHRLAGSAGTFGFGVAGETARELEHALGGSPLVPDRFPRLADLAVRLRHELEAEPAHPPQAAAAAGDADLLIVGADRERMRRLADESAARGLPAGIALSPQRARELIAARPVRIVLLDPNFPGGLDAALEFLAEVSVTLPVLVLTDPDGELDRVEVARRGGRGFLSRSLAVSELIDHVVGLRERLRAQETTILAVDDDPLTLDAIRTVLNAEGLTTRTCADPGRLWEELERHTPDLLLLDIEMPGVSGLELCRAVRNDPRWSALPVLILTEAREPGIIETIFAAGADDYVAKPLAGRNLPARIANRLERVRQLRALADTDHLTGLANRRGGGEAIETLRLLSRRGGQPLCVAVLDIDAFKRVNDTQGHAAGDATLRALGRALTQHFRGEDVISRWGGDEFVIGMYGMPVADARQRMGEFVEQIRGGVLGDDESRRAITVSAGVAAFPADGADVDALYRAADEALYAAKAAGGDRVRVAGEARDAADELDVVVVEDDEVLGDLLEHALVTRGYRTQRIADGLRACELLAGSDPQLHARVIVLDWDLPSMDGLRVLQALAQAGALRHTNVIMLTARSTEGEVLKALEAGAVDHVAKPFSLPVLMQRIRRALDPAP